MYRVELGFTGATFAAPGVASAADAGCLEGGFCYSIAREFLEATPTFD